MPATVPLILFGACDRHNFGDLLFPHVAAALQPEREIIVAGLAARDLTPDGGHRVAPLVELAGQWRDRPVEILHVGKVVAEQRVEAGHACNRECSARQGRRTPSRAAKTLITIAARQTNF